MTESSTVIGQHHTSQGTGNQRTKIRNYLTYYLIFVSGLLFALYCGRIGLTVFEGNTDKMSV